MGGSCAPHEVLDGPVAFMKVAGRLWDRWVLCEDDEEECERVQDEWDKLIAEWTHMDYKKYADDLQAGKTVQFRPKGNSMEPKISSGDLVTVEPFPLQDPRDQIAKKGDIVFCRVYRNYYVHMVQSVKGKMGGFRYQIGNAKNHTNGTIGRENMFGRVVKVEK
jgi:hypothetical protein